MARLYWWAVLAYVGSVAGWKVVNADVDALVVESTFAKLERKGAVRKRGSSIEEVYMPFFCFI